jgi:hypothetical protein
VTGAAILVSRDIKPKQRPRHVSLVLEARALMQDATDAPQSDIEQTLRLFQAKPHLLIGEVTLERAIVWLGGFDAGCSAAGAAIPREISVKVLNERGWEDSAHGPVPQMRKKGLSDTQVISELVEIQVAAHRSRTGCGPTKPCA